MQPLPNSKSDTDGAYRAAAARAQAATQGDAHAGTARAAAALRAGARAAGQRVTRAVRGRRSAAAGADRGARRGEAAHERQAALDRTAPPAATGTIATQTLHTFQKPSAPAPILLDDPAPSDPYSSTGAMSEQHELASAGGSNAASEHPWSGKVAKQATATSARTTLRIW